MLRLVISLFLVPIFLNFSYAEDDVELSDYETWNATPICKSFDDAVSVCSEHYEGLDEDNTSCEPFSLGFMDNGERKMEQKTAAGCGFDNGEIYVVSYSSDGHLIWVEDGGVYYPSRYT